MKNTLSVYEVSAKSILAIFLLSFVLLFAGCGMKKQFEFSGKTMGTTYHVKIVAEYFENTKMLQEEIDMRLDEINQSMSTFRKDSEISRFNELQTVGEKFQISDDFYNVLTVAKKIYEETNGAWDGTVKPLVDLWGFNKSENKHTIPEKKQIAALL
ncbi:MAG TPA: FAD:protein FMN transferase, partial [Desulfobacterales bacterium]|nr:FAD:protein FMN transferase [Desulfobacterales bacterium]